MDVPMNEFIAEMEKKYSKEGMEPMKGLQVGSGVLLANEETLVTVLPNDNTLDMEIVGEQTTTEYFGDTYYVTTYVNGAIKK